MAEKLFLKITIEGKGELKSVRSFSINQPLFDHHSCEVVVPVETFVESSADMFAEIGNVVGKDIEIEWETSSFKDQSTGDGKNVFKGIITDVSISGNRKEHMLVVIRSASPTVLLDGTPHSQCFADLAIDGIYDAVASRHLAGKVEVEKNLSFTDALSFTTQYSESDFDLMRRLCYQHGEWFYYDGEKLQLGIATGANSLELTPDKVFSLDFKFSVVNPMPKVMTKDYIANTSMEIKGQDPSYADSVASQIYDQSKNLFPAFDASHFAHPSVSESDSTHTQKSVIEKRAASSHASSTNQVMVISGSTDHAEIGLGTTIQLKNFGYDGEYVVIRVSHFSKGKSNYQNHFEAIPSDVVTPPAVPITYPNVSNTVATVVDNQDPENMGRVRVNFPWGGDVNSPWLRMVLPHAGEGRGFYFVPEVGDEVMVGFEMDSPDFPYVIGAIYNGQQKFSDHYNADDNTKAIKTKSGNEIIFKDGDQQLIVQNEKNVVTLDFSGDGAVTITSDGNIELTAGMDMSLTAGGEISITAGKDVNVEGANINQTAQQKIGVEAGTDVGIKGLNVTMEGSVSANISGGMTKVESKGILDVKATGITNISGAMVKLN